MPHINQDINLELLELDLINQAQASLQELVEQLELDLEEQAEQVPHTHHHHSEEQEHKVQDMVMEQQHHKEVQLEPVVQVVQVVQVEQLDQDMVATEEQATNDSRKFIIRL